MNPYNSYMNRINNSLKVDSYLAVDLTSIHTGS
jgi:hypothetical protein